MTEQWTRPRAMLAQWKADDPAPPRGYMPFLAAMPREAGTVRWIVATPFCDDGFELTKMLWDDAWNQIELAAYTGDRLVTRERILATFEQRMNAVIAAWEHARRWWDGEPPAAPAIPTYDGLPFGYAAFVEADPGRNCSWIYGPRTFSLGKISGCSLQRTISNMAGDAHKHAAGNR